MWRWWRSEGLAGKRPMHRLGYCCVVLRWRDLEVDDQDAPLGQALREVNRHIDACERRVDRQMKMRHPAGLACGKQARANTGR